MSTLFPDPLLPLAGFLIIGLFNQMSGIRDHWNSGNPKFIHPQLVIFMELRRQVQNPSWSIFFHSLNDL
jgi:hypothetical protein